MQLRRYAGPVDDDGLARLRPAVRAVDGDAWLPGPDEDAGLRPVSWLAEVDGTIVGLNTLLRWIEDSGTEVFLLTGAVHPAHRNRGYGTALLRRQEADVAALQPDRFRAVLAANADDTQPGAQQLLVDNGFSPAFTVVVLSRPVTDADDPRPLPAGIETRSVRPGQQPAIHAAIHECFRGSRHGYQPLELPAYLDGVQDTDLWVVAWDGDDVVGLVINERKPDGSVDSPWVAVRAPYRRRGLAAALLQRSLATMAAHGITTATVGTVAENENDSVALYEKAGYRVVRRSPRFRKSLTGES